MSITTYTSPAWIEEIKEHDINCPICNVKMTLKDYYKKKRGNRGEHFLTTAICYNGCKNEDAEPGDTKEYYFVGHNLADMPAVLKRIIKYLSENKPF